jgi:hypothetical protein
VGVNSRSGVSAVLVLAGVCGFALMLWMAQRGPGVSPDSTTYIEAARSLLAGDGLSVDGKPLTHYPPAYPLLLVGAGLIHGGDILGGGRVLGALLFGVNIALLGLAVYISTGRSLSAAGLAILVFLFSPAVAAVHYMAWSEASFITFCLAAFLLVSLHIARPRSYLLVSGSLTAGFAALTRYAGVSLVAAIALALLLIGGRPLRHRVRDAVLATGIALLPLASWSVRNVLTAHTTMDRAWAIHPLGSEHATRLVRTLHDFAFPVAGPTWMKGLHLGLAVVLFAIALAILHRKGYTSSGAHSTQVALPALSVLFLLAYIAVLAVSISFFDAYIPLDSRILIPAVPSLTIAFIWAARSTARVLDRRIIWYGFAFFALVSTGMNARLAVSRALDMHENGAGYTSRHWQESETLSYLSNIGDTRMIYSNGPEVIRFLTAKQAVTIPVETSASTRRSNPDYGDELNRMCAECRAGEALVVYLDGITWRWYLPSIEELESSCELPVLMRFKDGTVYGRREEAAHPE